MGIFLNRGKEEFERVVNSKIYVDKTDMLTFFNDVIDTEQAYVCVSRPRRFGKSITANMIAAYFEKGMDSTSLFEGRKISQEPDWKRNMNRYDVIRIDFADIRSRWGTPEEALLAIERGILRDLSEAYPDCADPKNDKVADALDRINSVTGNRFVIIIDEWDTLFRDEKSNRRIQDEYINLLRSLFKGNSSKKFTALAYITGILPIKKYNSESALNNFREFTMISPKKLSSYIGFTTQEVRELCDQYDMDFETVCSWYDGYSFGKEEHIFGPNSVVLSMLDGECSNYWSQTVAFNSLSTYITMNFDGLKDAIVMMLGGEPVPVKVRQFQNDMVSYKSKDDVLTVLIHLGYLAYDQVNEKAYIPNKEVRMCFEDNLEEANWDDVVESIEQSEELLEATLDGDEETVAEMVEECHIRNCSILKYNNENSLSCAITLAYYTARKEYMIFRELPAGRGFADLVFYPKKGVDKPAMIVELKWKKDVETALTQIKEKKYLKGLEGYHGTALLVGISYEKAKKGEQPEGYRCVIEQVQL